VKDPPDFYELLAALHDPMHGKQDTLEAIVALACQALHSEHAGVMLVHEGLPRVSLTLGVW
jgi:hypothetical protein